MKTAFSRLAMIPMIVIVLWMITAKEQRITSPIPPAGNSISAAGRAAVPDTQQLKQSAWFSIVCKHIEQDMYHFRQEKDHSLQSENPLQLITGAYSYDHMQLESTGGSSISRAKADKWKLALRLEDISFNGNLYLLPVKNASVQQHDSSLVFDHAGAFKVQYLNTPEGVRQNFIVNHAPDGIKRTERISIHMALESGLRAYVSVGGQELHFARRDEETGGLKTELLYTSLKAWDARGKELTSFMETGREGKEISIQIAAGGAVYPITIDPLSTTASTTLNGAATGNKFGYSLASAGDVNGDGYSDVIVGTGVANKAYVYYGSASGLSVTAAWTGTQVSGSYGAAVASAGDINGDGYSDVIVGAPGNNEVFVYYGSSSGLAATAAWTATQPSGSFGTSVALAGDVNGDGYSDIIVGANGTNTVYGYYGSVSGLPALASWTVSGANNFGVSVASAGDVNGDGFSDVIVGANTGNLAYAYYGSASGLSTSAGWTSTVGAGNFGYSVASAGDVNGDGYSDIIIGAYSSNKAFVFYGSSSGINTAGSTTLTGASGSFGFSVAGAGDVNGDGFSDLVVGSNGGNNAFVYFGSAAGASTTSSWTGTGAAGSLYGYCVAPAGDVNGDGFSDVIVGATGVSSNTGAAYVYTGSAAGTLTTTTWTKAGAAGETGFKVACAGDVNADGYSDVLVGVSGVPGPLGGTAYAGAAYLYNGSATGLSTTASWSKTGAANSDYGTVAAAGDVNGDGYADVIVGASGTSSSTGAAYVYFGSSSGLSTTVSWTGTGPVANSNYGFSLGTAGDVNADGYSDIIVGTYAVGGNAGAAYVYYGSASGPALTASWTGTGAVNSYYGGSVASAGDVNGDGYSDIIVGAPGVGGASGAVYVYYGSATGLATTAAWSKTGSGSSIFGISVASAGDVNGDGFSDVIIGASGVPPSGGVAGSAYVYNGSASGLAATASWSFTTAATNTFYGWSVASAGDVNGDGYSDIIVGAFGTGSNAGAAYMYYGSSAGVSASASWTVTGAANSYYGGSVASAGDVNGDGYSDVITGPYGKAAVTATAYLYGGNSAASNNAGTLQLWNTNLVTPISASNLPSGTFGGSIRPVSFTGRTKARLVWDEEKNGVSFTKPGATITQSASINGQQSSYGVVAGGLNSAIVKTLVQKTTAIQYKIRMRMQFSLATAITGQVYGPWKYSADYMAGNLTMVALPVLLAQFNGQLTEQGRVLNWLTAQETGGTHFEPERSEDGRVFTSIGSVTAKGEASGAYYTFTDDAALAGVTVVYYRIKTVDIDGNYSYSDIIAIPLGESNGKDGLNLINTMVNGTAFILYTTEKAGSLNLRVVSLSGQIMMQQNLGSAIGINRYSVDMQSLPKGLYVLQGAAKAIKFVRL
jgi:FG-GAP-like repeat/FG-GAP repeat